MKKRALFTVPISLLLIAVIVASFILINIKPDTSSVSQAQKLSEYTKPAFVRIVDYSVVHWQFDGIDPEVESFLQQINDQTVIGGLGSGAIISSDGYIVTNAHVVETSKMTEQDTANAAFKQMVTQFADAYNYNYDSIYNYMSYFIKYTSVKNVLKVILPSGDSYDGEIKSYGAPVNEGKDAAVLKIEEKNLPTLPIGNSDTVQNQDNIWVIGYPAAADSDLLSPESTLVSSMNEGQVSAIAKKTEQGSPVIQINAASTHGNSGGPVINEQGQIIGLLTFRGDTVNGQEVQGFNFAVPINTVNEFIKQAGASNTRSETDTLYQEGLTLYWGGYYKDALNKFEAVQRVYPNHSEIKRFITDSEKNIDHSKILWSNYKTGFYVVDGISLLLIILLMLYTFFYKPKRPETSAQTDGDTMKGQNGEGVINFPNAGEKQQEERKKKI